MADDVCDAILLYGAVQLPAAEAASFFDAMAELPRLLLQAPVEVAISAEPMPDTLQREVLELLSSADGDMELAHCRLTVFLAKRFRRPHHIILACADDHPLAKAAQRNNPDAVWGGAFFSLAFTYRPRNHYLIWHEALHLLGANDCYALPNRGPTCERSNCIMQYEPDEADVGLWPFLCEVNSRRVQDHVARFAAAIRWRA